MAHPPPPPPHYSPQTNREWDRRTIEEFGLPGVALMETAGARAAAYIAAIHRIEPDKIPAPFIILCGPGNNGGDGYVIARHLDNDGIEVEVWLAFDRDRLDSASDAGIQLAVLEKCEVPIFHTPAPHTPPASLDWRRRATIVDALLGTGLSRPLGDPYLSWVRAARGSGNSIVAIDVPTGLDGETGEIRGEALPATYTVTFAGCKRGFVLADGPATIGIVTTLSIGIPRVIQESCHPGIVRRKHR